MESKPNSTQPDYGSSDGSRKGMFVHFLEINLGEGGRGKAIPKKSEITDGMAVVPPGRSGKRGDSGWRFPAVKPADAAIRGYGSPCLRQFK